MVGDMAGILNLVMARDTDVAWSPEIKMLAFIVEGEVLTHKRASSWLAKGRPE